MQIQIGSSRNYGIELLRIISMFMVVVLHVIGSNNLFITSSYLQTDAHYLLASVLETLCYCAVNVYAIISGFVGYKSKFKLSRIVKLWSLVFFFSVISYVLEITVLHVEFSLLQLIKVCFPLLTSKYWYFSAYILVAILSPAFNVLIEKMGQKLYFAIMFLLLLFIGVCGVLFGTIWGLSSGYSALWLSILYFVGAYFAKYGLLKMRKLYLFLIYIVSSLSLYLIYIIMIVIGRKIEIFATSSYMFHDYLSVFVIIQAIALVNLFAKINVPSNIQKMVGIIASLTFGIYIIHGTPFFYQTIMTKLSFILNYHSALVIPFILILAIAIFTLCCVIEYVRQLIFKYCKIDRLIDITSNKLSVGYTSIVDKLLYKNCDSSRNESNHQITIKILENNPTVQQTLTSTTTNISQMHHEEIYKTQSQCKATENNVTKQIKTNKSKTKTQHK